MADNTKKKEPFEVETAEGKIQLAVKRPEQAQLREAQKNYNATFRDAIDAGAIVKARVNAIMAEQKLWDDTKEEKQKELENEIKEIRKKISGGGKVSELKELSFKVKKASEDLRELNNIRNSLDQQTAESQAEAERFNRLVSLCTVYNDTGALYYKNYEDFLARREDKIANEASTKLMYMYYGLSPNFEANLPENKFLRQFNLIDDKQRLLNKDGKPVNADGKLINDDGRMVDEQGNFVDKEGNRIDQDGNVIPNEILPFLDDDGNPITPPNPLSPAN